MLLALPPVTRALLIANVVMYLLQQVLAAPLVQWLALWPLSSPIGFQPWQIVTYAFLHGGLLHLFFNMFALYMFGGEFERVVGQRRYLAYYLVSVVTAGLAQLLVTSALAAPPYPTVGASGGVFGLLLAFGMYFPRRIIVLLIPPIPMPAWLFVTLYGALELFLGVTGTQQGVAHFAHLGGMLGGYLMIRSWGRRRMRR